MNYEILIDFLWECRPWSEMVQNAEKRRKMWKECHKIPCYMLFVVRISLAFQTILRKVHSWLSSLVSGQSLSAICHIESGLGVPSETFFVLIDKFVDACGIPHRALLFKGLPLEGLLLILVCPTLNLCALQFTVDFVITFCMPYTTHILKWISLSKTLFGVENWITLCCLFLDTAAGVTGNYFSCHGIIFNRLLQNVVCAFGIPFVTCAGSFGATVLPHVENGWATQNFWSALVVSVHCFGISLQLLWVLSFNMCLCLQFSRTDS